METGPPDADQAELLGKYVKARRGAVSQASLAQVAGISTAKWVEIEKGRGRHARATLLKVAVALNESPRHLLSLAGMAYDELPPNDRPALDRLDRLERTVDRLTALVEKLVEEQHESSPPAPPDR